MNGFGDHGLDESAFGEKKGLSEGIRSFDAFRKTHAASSLLNMTHTWRPRDTGFFANMPTQPMPPFKSVQLTSLPSSQN